MGEPAPAPIPNQRWLRIIPAAFVMYTIAFVDRTNIALALGPMSRDLHMDPARAGDAAGIFFWGYVLLQIPGGYFAEHWSAKRFVSILLVLWGTFAVLCGLIHRSEEHTSELQSRGHLVCRLLLEKKKNKYKSRILRRFTSTLPSAFWQCISPLSPSRLPPSELPRPSPVEEPDNTVVLCNSQTGRV